MKLTARGLNRSTLGRQFLLQRESLDITDALRRVVALQAQQPPNPYLALWNRVAGFDPADLDAAFVDGTVVKANAVRMTLHAVRADDYRVFREATEPSLRAAKLDSRFTESGLTQEDADALIPDLLAFAGQRRKAFEMEAWLAERLGSKTAARAAWQGLRQYAPLLRAPTGETWSFGIRPSYIAPQTMPVLADVETADASLQTLVLRYLEGFGPASVADVAQFAQVERFRARGAIEALGDDLEQIEGPNGEELFDIPGGLRPDEDTPAPPRLMAMWDNIMLSYFDRNRVIPPDYLKRVIRVNGDVLPTLLVDGYVAGVWRPVEGGIEATVFHELSDDAWEGLAAEAQSMMAFLADREPGVYSRFNHWWHKLRSAEVRVLPGDQKTDRVSTS